MITATPFFREAGSGPSVVCLHSNASSSSQGRDLLELLAPRFHVLAPDFYGSGKSMDWHSDRFICLNDEVDFIEPVLDHAGQSFFMVAHSYGAATALKVALRHPKRVRAMVLYEPTLFSLIDAQSPVPNAADGIRYARNLSMTQLRIFSIEITFHIAIDLLVCSELVVHVLSPNYLRRPVVHGSDNYRKWPYSTESTYFDALSGSSACKQTRWNECRECVRGISQT